MTYEEYLELHKDCVEAMKIYFTEAKTTSAMLGQCTPEPLPFDVRLKILAQEITENDAHKAYLGAKQHLHIAALRGYGFAN